MIRYINYVLTAILVMLVLPFAPFLAVVVIPVALIYYLVEPREKFWQEFSLRRLIRSIGFKPPKKALALYVFWLYVHLVFLGAFSSGIFNPTHMGFANFWPFNGDLRIYDITEFMVYTGPPLFFILVYGLSRHEVHEDEFAFSDGISNSTYQSISPIVVEPITPETPAVMPIVEAVIEDEMVVVDRIAPEVPTTEMPVYALTTNQELLQLIQEQQRHMEMMDAELQNLKSKMAANLSQKA